MTDTWSHLLPLVAFGLAVVASFHAVLHKRDVRAAIGWVGLVWLVPILGMLLYSLLGVNRIERKARSLRARNDLRPRGHQQQPEWDQLAQSTRATLRSASLQVSESDNLSQLISLADMLGRVTLRPLLAGNRVKALHGGDVAYARMISAIDGARTSVTLVTYIFDNDIVGQRFVEALASAVARGVEVRVLVDAVGARYSSSRIDRQLRKRGVPVGLFLPVFAPWLAPFFNLRNHRKSLVIDGHTGFTGGMNLRAGNLSTARAARAVRDIQFELKGPVVAQLQEAFVQDWLFTRQETLVGETWFPHIDAAGETLARVITDGPDDDFEKMRWAFLGALACASHRVQIMTPYFLPDAGLISALNVAALRGIDVHVVVPERSNIPLADWAMWGQLGQMSEHGCRVSFSPPPFEHTKLLVVDERWVLFGSANWDPRSLRLNFELGVESYDRTLAREMSEYIQQRGDKGRELSAAQLANRCLAVRIRDGLSRLLLPYL